MTQRPIYKHLPFILLILAQLTFGLITFRDFGLTWDEPLFYAYGDALGYAYTPGNWFRSDFNLANSYGPSADDHKTRGPAYLLLAREPVYALQSLGVDEASAWHLVNFLSFLLGVYFIYRLSLRWMGGWAAFGAAALFSTQPLLLGHAFINPKDMPFLVFFTGALLFGFEMVDALNDKTKNVKQKMWSMVVAAFFLGVATSNRVIAPLAGILVVVYAIVQLRSTVNHSRSIVIYLLAYTLLSIFVMFATWPYLWESPLHNFFQVFLFMSDNPTGLQVLFGGQVYRAFDLPRRYLPTLLAITLTESVWPLFILGLGINIWKAITRLSHRPPISNRQPPTDYWLTLTAFLIPFIYVLALRPPMYDGFRHFLFIVPPVFVTVGLGLQFLFDGLSKTISKLGVTSWLYAGLVLVLVAPNFFAIASLHPFEYTYYNSFVGGTGGALRTYETDYWLTCYKQAVEQFNLKYPNATLFVHREPEVASPYAAPGITVLDERGNLASIQPGDFILVNSRTNEDRKTFHDAPVVIAIGRDGATFCEIKSIP